MRLSLKVVAPSAAVILSTALLCATSGTALSQGSATSSLPAVSVESPKPVVRATAPRPGAATTTTSRRASGASTAANTAVATNPVLGRIARLERAASSCNDGCETSYRVGNQPWVGCSYGGEGFGVGNFSTTCTDTLTHRTYLQCMDTKTFLGSTLREARWFCSSLQASGKLAGERQLAEIKAATRR